MSERLVGALVEVEFSDPDPGRSVHSVPLGLFSGTVIAKHQGLYGRICYYVSLMQSIGVERFGVKVDSNTISISPGGEDRPDKGDAIAEEMSAKGKVTGDAILVRRNPLPSIVTQDMVQASDSKPFNDQEFVYVGSVEMTVKDSQSNSRKS